MQINHKKIVKRWNLVMNEIGCEYLTIGTNLSELESHKVYYGIENGIDTVWMLSEAEYWLSCYYESGNVRCDDKYLDWYSYEIWVQETTLLKDLINEIKRCEIQNIVEW